MIPMYSYTASIIINHLAILFHPSLLPYNHTTVFYSKSQRGYHLIYKYFSTSLKNIITFKISAMIILLNYPIK